jgi:hypothetical protein
MPEILNWGDIQERFKDGLLLGNGASMAVHAGFGYASLFKAACDLGHVEEEVKKVFDSFDTEDFELVLRRLWQAKLVNEALGIPLGRIGDAYQLVRTALIGTVRATHVTHADAKPHLEHIYPFLQKFKTVVSLNYDLILYWAAMLGNSNPSVGAWFKDAFKHGEFREDWESVREPYKSAEGSTLYFYPHGNLVLARTAFATERKIAVVGSADLLEAILVRWEGAGQPSPIFVCEGTSEHKKSSIASSDYLRTVFREVIPQLGESLVVYGWSMSDQDAHIVAQLKRANIKRAAVSVRGDNQWFMQSAEEQLNSIGIDEVLFFHSSSPGCWNNPSGEDQTKMT